MVSYHIYFRNEEVRLLEWAKATYHNSLSTIIKQHLSQLRQGSAQPVVCDPRTHEILVRRAYNDVFRKYECQQSEQELLNWLRRRDDYQSNKLKDEFSETLDDAWMRYKEYYNDIVQMFFDRHGQVAKIIGFKNPLEPEEEQEPKNEGE